MSGAELKDQLAGMGWSQGELGRRLDVHPNTVNEWAQGRRKIPGYVAEYLRVMLLAKQITR